MHQPRIIQSADAKAWLEALFDYALFNETNRLELDALLEILGIVYESAHYPIKTPNSNTVKLLLDWSYRYVDIENWNRLSAAIRLQREYQLYSQEEALGVARA